MKKPNIDMSQEGIQKFLLHHVEKVILGLAIAALGYLFWNGWSTEKYSKTEPKTLAALATRAKQHIDNPNSWSQISSNRAADSTAHTRIEDANKRQLNPDDYAVRRFLGTKRASLGLRDDPTLSTVIELVAKPYRAPVLLKISDARYQSAVSQLPNATSPDKEAGEKGGGGNRQGEAGGGLGEGGSSEEDDKKKDEVVEPFGDSIPGIMAQEMLGFRPVATQAGTQAKYNPLVLDAVAVTGVVNFNEQFQSYETVFRNAIGYYPLRDRPQYLFMEVQRREFQANPADAAAYDASWKDISQQFVDDRYGIQRSPEVVSPENYDEVLTRNIPPLVNYDYRQLASHSKVSLRKMVPAGMSTRNVIDKVDASAIERNPFETGGSDPDVDEGETGRDGKTGDPVADKEKEIEDVEAMKGNNRFIYDNLNPLSTPKADFKLVRFFDYRATPGKTYEYRVRLWLNDPNDPRGFAKGKTKKTSGIDDSLKGEFKGPSEAGGDDGSSAKGDDEEDLTKYSYTMIQTNLQEQKVRRRLTNKKNIELPKFTFRKPKDQKEADQQKAIQENLDDTLSTAWATEWSQPTPPVKVGSNPADYYAGKAAQPAVVRYDGFSIPREEKSLQLVTSFWSSRENTSSGTPSYNTAIPVLKNVLRGDVLNLKFTKAHIMDPSNGDVKRLKNSKIKTDSLVVDLMGGDVVGSKFKVPVSLPSEVLIMDANGKFRLRNSSDDLTPYRHSLFLDDEDASYGKARRKKSSDDGGGNRPDF